MDKKRQMVYPRHQTEINTNKLDLAIVQEKK